MCAVLTLRAGEPALKPSTPDSAYEFSTAKYNIRMYVRFPVPYEGKRLVVYNSEDPGKAVCPVMRGSAAGCAENFVGALAVILFRVSRIEDGKPPAASIREVVTVIDQSKMLPERPPSTMRVKLVRGLGSDTQAFGYDESSLPATQRAAEREAARAAWRRYRQELYIGKDRQPFAIVEWLHTTTRIRILRVDAPPFRWRTDGEALLPRDGGGSILTRCPLLCAKVAALVGVRAHSNRQYTGPSPRTGLAWCSDELLGTLMSRHSMKETGSDYRARPLSHEAASVLPLLLHCYSLPRCACHAPLESCETVDRV